MKVENMVNAKKHKIDDINNLRNDLDHFSIFQIGKTKLPKISKQFCFDLNNNKSYDILKDDQIIQGDELEEPRFSYEKVDNGVGTDFNFKREIVWKNAIGFAFLHLAALYGFYLCFFRAKFFTNLWMVFLALAAGEGITVGAHRLWSHRSFKAKAPLRATLLALQTMSGQNCLWVWARDHRQHHRHSDTDADPHNASRGFFFSHIGWLMSKKHPEVIRAGRKIDMSDLEADPLIMFQKKYYKTLYIFFAILLPVYVPVYIWNESATVSFFVSYLCRYILQLHATWSVNSVAHLYGTRPYDKKLLPVESLFVSVISNGEGWHNYHHAFPWDYQAAEYGTSFTFTASLIRWLRDIGQAYDLKEATPSMVESRVRRTGDGTHHKLKKQVRGIMDTFMETH